MKFIIQTFLLLILTTQFVFAQKKLPILKANKTIISIKEGDFDYKDIWTISPEVKPDIFVTNPFVGAKIITFYSDIDTLSFTVKPNKKYDFLILLNGKDTAFTQINTDLKGKPSLAPQAYIERKNAKNNTTSDTLHFALGKDNRIHLKGTVNGSDSLDFLFDTGASASVITSSLIDTKKVNVQFDGESENRGTDGVATVKTSSINTFEIGNLIFKNVSILSIDFKNASFDAVLGWVAFEDKIVEIDYENNILIIHKTLPKLDTEYAKLEMKNIDGIHYIKCKTTANGKESEAWFDFDTGSNGTLIIGQKYASDNSLNNGLKVLGTKTAMGSTGIGFAQTRVLLPKLKFGDFEMYQIPININDKDPQGTTNNENIGNNILKRFNTVIDFKNKVVYLKPNNLFYSPF